MIIHARCFRLISAEMVAFRACSQYLWIPFFSVSFRVVTPRDDLLRGEEFEFLFLAVTSVVVMRRSKSALAWAAR